MSKNEKLIPKLRFPEFKGRSEWEMKQMDEVYSFKVTNSFSRANLNYKHGFVKNIHYGDIHTKFSTLFDITKEDVPFINPTVSIKKIKNDSYCQEGDIVFADASEDMDDIGKCIELIDLNNEKLLAGLHTILARQIKPKLVKGFAGYLFKSNSIKLQIKREAQGAKVLGISMGRLSNVQIYYPKDTEEQEKIANCLASLDKLIDLEAKALESLKKHKKGLLQQLFPKDGENIPKLRFSEFEEDGDWKLYKFSKYIKLYRGSSPRPIKEYITNNDNGVNWIKIGDTKNTNNFIINKVNEKITLMGAKKSRNVKKGELILANSMSYGKVYELNIDGCIYDGWFVLREYEDFFHKKFLLQLLNSEYIQNQYLRLAAGGIVQNISSVIVNNVMLPYTSIKEQEKIANCLTTLDDLVNAQEQKIESLTKHKKGLMQHLFPNIDNQ